MKEYPIPVSRAIIFNENNEFLLIKRLREPVWEFPGGKIENESAENCAWRETLEETGLKLCGEPTYFGSYNGKGIKNIHKTYIDLFFIWTKSFGEIKLERKNHSEYKWFQSSDSYNVVFMPSTAYILTQLRRESKL